MKRYLSPYIEKFSQKKLVLLSGPRQVGKTTAGKLWLDNNEGLYLNWDIGEDRKQIINKSFFNQLNNPAILLDEIHKYTRWKTLLKGIYDKHIPPLRVLVTGSAKLDIFKKSGDSLFGRYELLRLHPFSIGELIHGKTVEPPNNWLLADLENSIKTQTTWDRLEQFSGFPEPYFEQDPLQHKRWSTRRRELLIREDLREISDIKLVDLVEHLYILLPDRVGSPLSLNSLKEEIQVAYNSVSNWLKVLESLYICFRISPYHQKLSRSLKKEQKLYLWDWSQISDPAARFENIVACHLLKSVHFWNDIGFGSFDLQYFRNKEKEEVDFIITKDRIPQVLIECKLSDTKLSKSLINLSRALGNTPMIQLVKTPDILIKTENYLITTASNYLSKLV
jgi:predicted AAA+ superfamily ATPase